MYLKIGFKNLAAPLLHFKRSQPRREENKVEFFEGQFRTAKLSFVHKKKSEHSFELPVLSTVNFKPSEQRETLALAKKFDIGLSLGDGVHRELNRSSDEQGL